MVGALLFYPASYFEKSFEKLLLDETRQISDESRNIKDEWV